MGFGVAAGVLLFVGWRWRIAVRGRKFAKAIKGAHPRPRDGALFPRWPR